MRLAKTLTALSLAALLAMLPACSSSSSNRAAAGGGGGSAGLASLAHMDGKSLKSDSNENVIFAGDFVAYDATVFSKASDTNAAMTNDDRLVLDKAGQAAATIGSVGVFGGINAALAGLDTLGLYALADVTGVTGAGNNAAAATSDAQGKAKTALQGIIDDFNGQIDAAIAVLTDPALGFDYGVATTDSDNGKIVVDAAYNAIATGIEDDDTNDIVVSAAILKLLGFEWEN